MAKLNEKLLAAGLIAAVAAGLVINDVLDTGEKTPPQEIVAGELAIVAEVESERTENAEVFETNVPGKRVMRVYSRPVHYRDKETGRLEKYDFAERDVDASVKADPRRKHDKYVKIGNHGMGWMHGKKHDYRFNHESGYYVQYRLLTVQAGMAVETETNRDGVKQTYTMSDTTWTGRLRWTLETDATMTVNGAEVVYTDSTGAFLFRTSAPVAWDADGKDVPVTVTVTVQGDTLTYDADVAGVVWPVVVDPTTSVEATNDGRLVNVPGDYSYANVRDATASNAKETWLLGAGQTYSGGSGYMVSRGFLSFVIPSGLTTINSVSLYLYGDTDASTTDFEIYIHTSTHSNPLDVGDFDLFDGRRTGTTHNGTILNNTWNSSSFSATWNEIVLNASGKASVLAATGTTWKIALISKEDYNNSAPTDNEYVIFQSSGSAGKEPYLEITYIFFPTNFTLSATSSTSITASWTNVSADYDSLLIMNSPENTGVVYADSPTDESKLVTGLTPNTLYTYFVRADIAGVKDDSNADSTYTLANAPDSWSFSNDYLTGSVAVDFGVHSNPAGTEFAVRDSTNQKWVQTNGTLGTTADWDTYATWSSVTITETHAGSGDIIKYGVVARNGDAVETAYLWGDITVYSFPPTGLSLSATSTTSITASWTNNAPYDSLLIMNSPENTGVVYADSPTDESKLVTGLTPNTLYTYFVRADSSGTKGDSSADSTYTLANVPAGAAVTNPDTNKVTFTWTANSNSAGTEYAVSVYNATDDSLYYWTGAALSGTATWKTRPAWTLPETITGLRKDKNYYIGVKARNGDEVETTAVSVGVRTAERTQDSDPIAFTNFKTSMVTSAVYDSARVEQHADSIATAAAEKLGQSAAKMIARMSIDIPMPNIAPAFSGFQLHLRGKADYSTTDFLIRGSYGGWELAQTDERYYTWPGYTQTMSAYSLVNQMWENFNTSSFVIGDNVLIANSDGISVAEQAKGTTATWYLISSRDVSATSPSGNEYVEFHHESPDSSYAIYQWEYVEAVPYGVTATPLTSTTIAVTWNDSTLTNTGFLIVDGSTGVAYSDTLAHDAEADTLTGLTPNLLLNLKVKIVGGTLDGQLSSAVSVATYPNPFAAAPDTSGQTQTTITVLPDTTGWGNPSDTDFGIYFITSAGDTLWIDRTATPDTLKAGLGIDDAWGWGTYDQWGGASGIEVTGLDAGRRYTVGTMTRGREY